MFKKVLLAITLVTASGSTFAKEPNPQITHPSADCVHISTFPDLHSTANYLRKKIDSDVHKKHTGIDDMTDEQVVRAGFILYCGFNG